MRRALLSVTDKTGLAEFAEGLVGLGFEIVSTGGTARSLREAGLDVRDVSDVTGFPEVLDGRVKTLHPGVHAGLLADLRLDSHRAQLADLGIEPIQVAAVNLYAFVDTVTRPHEREEAVESIDIGGPAMVRAAAKNHANVAVVVDPVDYGRVLAGLRESGSVPEGLRLELAAKAFRHTAYYDSMVARYLSGAASQFPTPETLTVGLRRTQLLRYGENPHQEAALYLDPLARTGVARAEQLWGKALSYNNILDANAAWELASDLPAGSCVVVKHGNPCGAALGATLGDSYSLARASDTVSAFGGIAALAGEVDASVAEALTAKGNFLEVVIATGFTEEALAVFRDRSGWGQDVRLLKAALSPAEPTLTLREVRGGYLAQTSDEDPGVDWQVVTERCPSDDDLRALRWAWTVVAHVKSNAIVVAGPDRLLGVGAGQMNRVQSVRLALTQAGEGARGAALASDAFFPFPDSVETAAEAGIVAIVQPGGSKKDPDVMARANELGLSMVFTGVRHFRH